ncbi:MAG: TRAP transporter substrate-binding protein [Clostridia bacterium]|nr:TRAP transporter substrate-binding protein [Clostridia bacterium]
MRKSKKLVALVTLVLFMAVLLAGCSGKKEPAPATPDPAPAKIEITYGSNEQNNMASGLASQWVAKEITERSGGRLNVSYHGQGTIGGDQDLIQQVMAGQIQIAAFSIGMFSSYTPLLEAMQLPFLISDYEEEWAALNSDEWKALTKKVEEEFDVLIVAQHENGMRHFATIDKPVNTIADVKGVKMRVAPSVILQKAMELIGANPMAITYGEVVTALQNKTIDGEEINITSAGSQKHYDVIKYISEIGFYPYPGPAVINGKWFRTLSADDQKLILDVFAEGQVKNIKEFIPETEEKLRKECEDNGVKFNVVQDKQPFIDAVAPLYDEYSAKDPLIKAFIDKFK